MTDDDNDDSDRDGHKLWLAELSKKDSWFYSHTNQEGWKVMSYEGHWHIHSSFLLASQTQNLAGWDWTMRDMYLMTLV